MYIIDKSLYHTILNVYKLFSAYPELHILSLPVDFLHTTAQRVGCNECSLAVERLLEEFVDFVAMATTGDNVLWEIAKVIYY